MRSVLCLFHQLGAQVCQNWSELLAFSPYIGEHLEAFRFLDQKHGAFGLPRTDRDLTVNHDPLVRSLNRNLCHPMRQKCSKALMDTKSVNRFERRFPLSGKGPFRTNYRPEERRVGKKGGS